MYEGPPVSLILLRDGLPTCSKFVADRVNEIDPQLFIDHLCGPRRFVHVPLSCFFWDFNYKPDAAAGFETEQLLIAIDRFKDYHNIPEDVLGTILDHTLECHLTYRTFSSINDLTCLFSLLQSKNPEQILKSMHADKNLFWLLAFNAWIATFNVQYLPPAVTWLWKSGDLSSLTQVFQRAKEDEVHEFINEIDQIQRSPAALYEDDWQRIVNRKPGTGPEAITVLLAAALGRCFMNWLTDIDQSGQNTDLLLEIMALVVALVQERAWRFADISKLFRFSKRAEDLPALLAALTQIYEGNLRSSALDKLPNSIPKEMIGEMLEGDMEFEPAREIPRNEAIKLIVNSDFGSYTHSSAPITEAELHKMMSSFDESYRTGGGEFANVAKAVKAVEQFEKIKMRDVQILAILLSKAARRANVARLLQMQTGEGKTYVIAAIAISEVLDGKKVDIITSSENLAVTQCAELRELYSSVGISIQENCTMDRDAKEKEKIYDADVIYGSASNFMFDALHQDFYESNIRGDRGYPLAIVDEVDSQMLDHANYVCRFASDTSGMGNLLGIQSTVWMLVSQNYKELKADSNGWTVKSDDGDVLISDVRTLKKYFRDGLLEVLQKMAGFIPGAKEEEIVHIPQTLWDYAKKEMPSWIDSAVEAFLKRKDFDYCVEEGEVIIVDSARSGTRNKGMRWSHGLHEFLEMLNAANLKSEILSMCFLSTLSFCKRYKTNLIGLTGTIGGTPSRKFLSDVYSVDFVEIPPFMYWRHIKLPHVFCSNTEEWLTSVVKRVVDKLHEGRACLVITQYIHYADVLYREISKRANGRIGTYTGAATDISIEGKLEPGACIIATNVAGRGTDLKISNAVEEAGGLHVVLTSLPENDRVERQNIGRSSRTGQRGTSQMILNWDHINSDFLELMLSRCGDGATHTTLVNALKDVRDDWNLQCVESWIKQMAGIERADTALREFIKLRNDCVAKFKKPDDKENEKSYFQKNIRGAINFRFGVYLTTCDWSLEPKKIQEDFGDLASITMENVGKCFHDYAYPVFAAWNIGNWDPEEEPEVFEVVQKLFGRAIELDPKFAGAAHYMRAITFLYLYRDFQNKKYIIEAIDDFQKCRKVIESLLDQYNLTILITKKKGEAKTKLEANMERLMAVCNIITGSIDSLIGRNVGEELNKYRGILEGEKKNGKDTSQLEKTIQQLEENKEQLEKGVLRGVLDNGHEIKFKMHKLEDMMPESLNKKDHQRELDHFYQEGYMRVVTVEDVKPIKWWDVIAVAALGILQLVAGGLLTVFTGGTAAAIGVGLMLNGAFDIYTAIKDGIIDRDFDWNMYGLGKAIDVLTLGIPAGASGLKAAAKGIVQGVKNVAKAASKKFTKEILKHSAKQAVKAAATVGVKVAVTETLNATVAAPIREAVSDLLVGAIKEALKNELKENQDLRTLVDRDNANNNKATTSEFVNRGYDDFVRRVSSEFLDHLRKSIGAGVHQNLANKGHGAAGAVKAAMDVWTTAQIVSNIIANLKFLPDLLREIANRPSSIGSDRYENREYEQHSTLSMDDVISDLSSMISKFCAMKAVSRARDFFSSKLSHLIVDKQFKNTQQQLEHFKKGFTLSHDVAERARSAKKTGRKEDNGMLEHIASVADDMDKPGDRFQARYLAEAVQSPIEIEYIGEDGRRKIIVYGQQYSKNPPVRLRYERGTGPIGHYSFKDGTHFKQSGKNTCLFDTVAHATKYNSKELKRAAANFMLDDIAMVRYIYDVSTYANRLVGGVRTRGPPVSIGAMKHVEECTTVDDVLRKSNNRQTSGRYLVPRNDVIDYDKDKFDNAADNRFDKWKSNYLAKHGTNPPNGFHGVPQHDYFHDESTIYEVRYNINKRRGQFTPTEIYAYRAKPFFAVEEHDGAVHFEKQKTINPNHPNPSTQQPPSKQLIWRQGDPTDEYLRELYDKHPDYGNILLDYPGF